MRIKKDKYFRARGKTAKIIILLCAQCKNQLFLYQKDGFGWLKRCYFNRIISDNISSFNKLKCRCGNIIGYPIKYKDGRSAFSLIKGSFKRTNFIKKENNKDL